MPVFVSVEEIKSHPYFKKCFSGLIWDLGGSPYSDYSLKKVLSKKKRILDTLVKNREKKLMSFSRKLSDKF